MSPVGEPASAADIATVAEQLGRPPRGVVAVAHRCPCGMPDVVLSAPVLPDGTPFPTVYYLTCPRAAGRIGTLEGSGLMRAMQEELTEQGDVRAAYAAAHERLMSDRAEVAVASGMEVPSAVAGVSAGGMPDRVKCLHVLAAQSLACGPGVNPLGDRVLEQIGSWWESGPCVSMRQGAVRVAAIDCGTNAIRLLIADIGEDGSLKDVLRDMRIVRLGENVDATGEFSSEALHRTFAALDDYAEALRQHRPSKVRFVATSASRDVANRDAFVSGVRERIGIEPEVISGSEEAGLSFLGATRGLPSGILVAGRPVIVVDIGGGSTEFVLSSTGTSSVEAVTDVVSVDIGCVRMTERHLVSDPPKPEQITATLRDVDLAIARAREVITMPTQARLVAVSGTATTVAAAALDLPTYDPERLHGSVIGVNAARAACETLLAMTRAERARLPYMHPGRVDVIGGGAMVLRAVVDALGVEDIVISETDILDGICYALVRSSERSTLRAGSARSSDAR